jgi:hypothetical protein
MASSREYCCALGMKPVEFYTLADWASVRSKGNFQYLTTLLYAGNNTLLNLWLILVDAPNQYAAVLMETYINGQGQSIWCGSNQTLNAEIPIKTRDFCHVPSCIGGISASDGFFVLVPEQANFCEGYGTRSTMMHFVCM